MTDAARCTVCGAPLADGLAACTYCNVPVPGRRAGVACPACGELSTDDRMSCAACAASFTKGCVFCGQVAFVTALSCTQCSEAFEGAEARKRQREEAAKQQQMLGIAAQGVSVLGQVAGTPSGRQVLGSLLDMVIKSNDGNR